MCPQMRNFCDNVIYFRRPIEFLIEFSCEKATIYQDCISVVQNKSTPYIRVMVAHKLWYAANGTESILYLTPFRVSHPVYRREILSVVESIVQHKVDYTHPI